MLRGPRKREALTATLRGSCNIKNAGRLMWAATVTVSLPSSLYSTKTHLALVFPLSLSLSTYKYLNIYRHVLCT